MVRSSDVEALLRGMYDSFRAGDGEAVVRLIAAGADTLFVGTDADEWWSGSEAVKAAAREQLEATGGFPIEPGDLRGYAEGDVGWFDDQPAMRMSDGTVVPMRMTGVARRSGGRWEIVQGHLSVAGSVNDALFG